MRIKVFHQCFFIYSFIYSLALQLLGVSRTSLDLPGDIFIFGVIVTFTEVVSFFWALQEINAPQSGIPLCILSHITSKLHAGNLVSITFTYTLKHKQTPTQLKKDWFSIALKINFQTKKNFRFNSEIWSQTDFLKKNIHAVKSISSKKIEIKILKFSPESTHVYHWNFQKFQKTKKQYYKITTYVIAARL